MYFKSFVKRYFKEFLKVILTTSMLTVEVTEVNRCLFIQQNVPNGYISSSPLPLIPKHWQKGKEGWYVVGREKSSFMCFISHEEYP